MPTITSQDIVDRWRELDAEEEAVRKREVDRIHKERESLREMCGGIGHVFAEVPYFVQPHRTCVFCGTKEA